MLWWLLIVMPRTPTRISGTGEDVRVEVAAWESGAEPRQAQERKAGQLQERAECWCR